MYPKVTREILSKFISNETILGKEICITFETEFDYGRFLSFLDQRGITWRNGVPVFKDEFISSNKGDFLICIFYKTFEGITWCGTSLLGKRPHDCIIYKLDSEILNKFF